MDRRLPDPDAAPVTARGMHVNRIVTLTAGLWMLAMLVEGQIAYPQQRDIAVVDLQSVMRNSNAAKDARVLVERMRAEYQRELKGKQDDMERFYQELAQERPTLSQDDYQQRMQELQQKAAEYQREVQEREGKLDGVLRGASDKITAAIVQIVDEIVKERRLALVLPRAGIVGTPAVPDITQEVLRRLNQRVPPVRIDRPK